MSDIRGLLERLESATGPDRELDALIAGALLPWDGEAWAESDGNITIYLEPSGKRIERSAPVTGSIDAALALVERVLGQEIAAYTINGSLNGSTVVELYFRGEREEVAIEHSVDAQPALAVVTALLSAKIAQEDS